MAISNEIFETFRLQEKAKKTKELHSFQARARKVHDCIKYVVQHGYKVVDLENNLIDKNTFINMELEEAKANEV